MGRETLYLVDTGLGSLRALSSGDESRHSVGDQVQIQFHDSDTLLFDTKSVRLIPEVRVSAPA